MNVNELSRVAPIWFPVKLETAGRHWLDLDALIDEAGWFTFSELLIAKFTQIEGRGSICVLTGPKPPEGEDKDEDAPSCMQILCNVPTQLNEVEVNIHILREHEWLGLEVIAATSLWVCGGIVIPLA